jgi:hypothetical protein
MSQQHLYGKHPKFSKNTGELKAIFYYPWQAQIKESLGNRATHQKFDIIHRFYQLQW